MAEPALLPRSRTVRDLGFAARDAERLSHAEGASFAAFALRTRSAGAREVLARAATRGALDRGSLLAVLGELKPHDLGLDPVWVAWLAYVEALSPDVPADVALDLLELAAITSREAGLPTEVADVRAQRLLRAGRRQATFAALDESTVSAETRWAVECDLANPALWQGEELDERRWLDLLSRPFVDGRVEAVTLEGAGETPFARLRASAPRLDAEAMKAGGMVSVVMSAFRPDRDIFAAARSILDQTWANLELLVVDDASPPSYDEVLAEVARLDPRVRVLRAPSNGGTYQARNLAFREASGEFMTFQDSDDWSHPRRIEVQVRALLDDPSILATRTPAIRAYPDLSLTWPGYPAQRPNASSLLFRRLPVHDLIGDFDAVRKSADMEYPRRLQAVRPKSVRDVDGFGPMAITQLRGGSLSRSDAVPGWIRWTRLSYQDAYLEWHERIKMGSADPRVTSEGPRPFPLPDPTWSPWRAGTEVPRGHFDVVVLGDWRSGRGPHRELLDEMRLLASAGLRVGIAHAEAPFPLPRKRQPRARPVQRLINAGIVELTHLDRPSDVGVLLVVDPDVLSYLPRVDVGLVPRTIVVVVDDAAAGVHVEESDRAVRQVFDTAPLWTARHRTLLEELRASAPKAVVDEEVLPFAVDVAGLRVTDRRLLGPQPVIGHHLPDEGSRWPRSPAHLLVAYPAEGVDVRLLHGTTAAARLLGKPTHPVGWLSFDGVDLTTRTFLSRLDFFVYLGVRDHVADHALLEAMAAGCVPIVTEEFRPLAGDGALYVATPGGEVAELVAELSADRARYRAVQERAMRHQDLGGGFVHRIERLCGVTVPGARDHRPTPLVDDPTDRRSLLATEEQRG